MVSYFLADYLDPLLSELSSVFTYSEAFRSQAEQLDHAGPAGTSPTPFFSLVGSEAFIIRALVEKSLQEQHELSPGFLERWSRILPMPGHIGDMTVKLVTVAEFGFLKLDPRLH
jgi:hypothetical protein